MFREIATTEAYSSDNSNSQAIVYNGTVYVSGQVPKDAHTGEIIGDDIQTQTRQVFENIEAILDEAGTSLDNLVKTTVFLRDKADYGEFNEVYDEFVTEPFPARSTVEIGDIVIDTRIEIEAVAAIEQ